MSTLSFHGGAGSVTGANFVLEIEHERIMIDCGLRQEGRFSPESNLDPFPYDPSQIGTLLVTHAHADHIGRIPKLVHDGFTGVIYSTPPTRDLAEVMLKDSYKVMLYEEERFGTKRCFDEEDIAAALRLWRTHPYGIPLSLHHDIVATFSDAGHILGSAMITLERNGKKITFTGDIGNVPQPLLNAPTPVQGYDYLVMESVYGDRAHEDVNERTELLRMHIEETTRKGGVLMIPAFSLERTQGMLLEINNLYESGRVRPIPVFLDSPLAIEVTEIYRRYTSYLKEAVQEQIQGGDDIFDFPRLSFTRSAKDSSEIGDVDGPKIIIAGSGMSHGGRIQGHERRYLEDPRSTLLLVGYQSVGSVGRLLVDGAKRVRILDTDLRVRAKVAQIRGYSGHADRDQLIDFVAHGCSRAKHVFVAMGEERSALFLVQRLRDYLGVSASAPTQGTTAELDF